MSIRKIFNRYIITRKIRLKRWLFIKYSAFNKPFESILLASIIEFNISPVNNTSVHVISKFIMLFPILFMFFNSFKGFPSRLSFSVFNPLYCPQT